MFRGTEPAHPAPPPRPSTPPWPGAPGGSRPTRSPANREDAQVTSECTLDRPIDEIEESGVHCVWCIAVRVGRPLHRQAHRIEAGLAHDVNVVALKPPRTRAGDPVQRTAKVDTSTEPPADHPCLPVWNRLLEFQQYVSRSPSVMPRL